MKQPRNNCCTVIVLSCIAVIHFLKVNAIGPLSPQMNWDDLLTFPSKEDKAFLRDIRIKAHYLMAATRGHKRRNSLPKPTCAFFPLLSNNRRTERKMKDISDQFRLLDRVLFSLTSSFPSSAYIAKTLSLGLQLRLYQEKLNSDYHDDNRYKISSVEDPQTCLNEVAKYTRKLSLALSRDQTCELVSVKRLCGYFFTNCRCLWHKNDFFQR